MFWLWGLDEFGVVSCTCWAFRGKERQTSGKLDSSLSLDDGWQYERFAQDRESNNCTGQHDAFLVQLGCGLGFTAPSPHEKESPNHEKPEQPERQHP